MDRNTSSASIAPSAACQPAIKFVKKNIVARSRELSNAAFQFHRWISLRTGWRKIPMNTSPTVKGSIVSAGSFFLGDSESEPETSGGDAGAANAFSISYDPISFHRAIDGDRKYKDRVKLY